MHNFLGIISDKYNNTGFVSSNFPILTKGLVLPSIISGQALYEGGRYHHHTPRSFAKLRMTEGGQDDKENALLSLRVLPQKDVAISMMDLIRK
jgi:hypothetical protein